MNRLELAPLDRQTGQVSGIVHLICCVESHPTDAFCGKQVTQLATGRGPECVECCAVGDRLDGGCVRGGRCPT